MKKELKKNQGKSKRAAVPEGGKKKLHAVLDKAIDGLFKSPAYTDPAASYAATLEAISVPSPEPPVSHEQWVQLYEVVTNIRKLSPWEWLHETDIVTLLLPGRDEPVYIVVMGSGNMTYGIGIYPGYYSMKNLLRMTKTVLDEQDLSIAFEQHCINLYFGDREELDSSDRNVIKSLGLKFRGRNEWPYFRSMKPGFMPWYLNGGEAELVISALQSFVMAYISYMENGLEVDFDKGETLLRFYDEDTEMWYNTVLIMPPTPLIQPRLIFGEEMLISKLKKKRKTRKELCFSIAYLPMPIQEKKGKRPKMPRMAMLIDTNNGLPIDQALDIETGFIEDSVFEMLVRYITKHGRPSSFVVRDDDSCCYIEDFAKKLDIEVEIDEELSNANSFRMGLINMLKSGELDKFMKR